MPIKGMVVCNAMTFVCFLQGMHIWVNQVVEQGKEVLSYIKVSSLRSNVAVGGSLLKMYAKCRSLVASVKLLHMVNKSIQTSKNVLTCSVIIQGYAQDLCLIDFLKRM